MHITEGYHQYQILNLGPVALKICSWLFSIKLPADYPFHWISNLPFLIRSYCLFSETLGVFRRMTRNSSLRFSGLCKTITPFACQRSEYLRGTFMRRNVNLFYRGQILHIIYCATTDKWWLRLKSEWLECCNITLYDRCKWWFNITKDAYDYIGTC